MQFVYLIVFGAGRRITFGCAFAVKTSVKGARTVAGASIMPARRFRRPTVRQMQFVYFIVFGARRRITFGAMDHAPAGKRKGARCQLSIEGLGGTVARKLSCALAALLAIRKQDITRTDNYYTALKHPPRRSPSSRWYKELFTLYKLCPSAMPSRDNSSIVASFLLFSVRSRAACAAPLQLNRVKES